MTKLTEDDLHPHDWPTPEDDARADEAALTVRLLADEASSELGETTRHPEED